jgi:hypothetical protein
MKRSVFERSGIRSKTIFRKVVKEGREILCDRGFKNMVGEISQRMALEVRGYYIEYKGWEE